MIIPKKLYYHEASIQLVTSDGKAVRQVTVKTYTSLSEAPKNLQSALEKRKIAPLKEPSKSLWQKIRKPSMILM